VATLPWPAQTCGSGEQTTLARWEGVSGLAARLYTPLYFTVRSTVAYRWQALGPRLWHYSWTCMAVGMSCHVMDSVRTCLVFQNFTNYSSHYFPDTN
jgi:hypothetical protein